MKEDLSQTQNLALTQQSVTKMTKQMETEDNQNSSYEITQPLLKNIERQVFSDRDVSIVTEKLDVSEAEVQEQKLGVSYKNTDSSDESGLDVKKSSFFDQEDLTELLNEFFDEEEFERAREERSRTTAHIKTLLEFVESKHKVLQFTKVADLSSLDEDTECISVKDPSGF